MPESLPEPVPAPVPESAPVSMPEPLPEPVPEPLPEPVSKLVSKPVPALEPLPKPVSMPESLPEPEPALEPLPKPAAESVPEPLSKPMPEPVSKPVPEPLPEQGQVKVLGSVFEPKPAVDSAPVLVPIPLEKTAAHANVDKTRIVPEAVGSRLVKDSGLQPAPKADSGPVAGAHVAKETPESNVDPDQCFMNAFVLRHEGDFLGAAELYSVCAAAASDSKMVRKALFSQLACYVKGRKPAEARELALRLRDEMHDLTENEAIKLMMVLGPEFDQTNLDGAGKGAKA